MSTPHIHDLIPHAERVFAANGGEWPWMVVGVFGTSEDVDEHGDYSDFVYSNGAVTEPYNAEYWCSSFSIEGRHAGPQIVSGVVNVIIGAINEAVLGPGDNVRVPLGIPDEDGEWLRDEDAIFWIGYPVDDTDNRFQCNMSRTGIPGVDRVIPIKWSSPLGWEDE